MIIGLLSGGIWFFIFVASHWIVFHSVMVSNRSRTILHLFAGTGFAHALTCVLLFRAAWVTDAVDATLGVSLIAGVLAMICLFVVYMPFYYTLATSLSVQSLILIDQSSTGSYSIAALKETFISERLVRGRLETMVVNGYLMKQRERYALTLKGKLISYCFSALKDAWRLGAGG